MIEKTDTKTRSKSKYKTVTTKRHCPVCGFNRRGKDHDQGEHHKRGQHGRMTPSK